MVSQKRGVSGPRRTVKLEEATLFELARPAVESAPTAGGVNQLPQCSLRLDLTLKTLSLSPVVEGLRSLSATYPVTHLEALAALFVGSDFLDRHSSHLPPLRPGPYGKRLISDVSAYLHEGRSRPLQIPLAHRGLRHP